MAGNRTQFTFYESFFKAVSRIKKKADRAVAYDILCAYALYGTEPDLDNLPDAVAISFEVIRPNLDAARKKAQGGKNGKPSAKDAEKKGESSSKDNGKMDERTRKQEKEKEQEKEQDKEQMLVGQTPPSEKIPETKTNIQEPSAEEAELGRLPVSLQGVMRDWLEYKKQRREKYAPVGLTALISETINNAAKYGEGAVAQVIRTSMASGYKGIVFDRLQQQAGKGRKEMVPAWADKQPSDWQKDAVRRMMEQEKNAGNDPELAARAEQLRERLGG